MKFKATAALALGIALTGVSLKAEEAATATHASMHDGSKTPMWYDKVKASCWVDAYYQYNLNGRSNTGPAGRAFDLKQQEFTLSAAQVSMSSSDADSGTSGQVDILYGPMVSAIQGALPANSLLVKQAFLTQTFGPLTAKFGKFVTYLGTEVIDTPRNLNYSRSNLFLQIPYYHVGLNLGYAVAEGFGISAQVSNGNSVDTATSEYKDYGLSISFTKVAGLSLIGNYYMESINVGPVYENQHYFQFLASYQIAESLGFSGEYLYKTRIAAKDTNVAGNLIGSTQPDPSDPAKPLPYSPKQQGYALYLNYSTPLAGLSIVPRFEQWYNPEGIASLMTDTTVTLKYASGPLTHYLEYRNDWMNMGGFVGAGGADPAVIVYSQNTVTYAATYSF